MLARLKAEGFRLAVVTNKATRFVRPHLDKAGILGYFDAIVGGDDAHAKKPDPAPIVMAAQRLGVPVTHMLMVGDSVNDAQAARAAGCPVVLLPHGYNEGEPVHGLDCDGIVPSLAAVADCVRRRGRASPPHDRPRPALPPLRALAPLARRSLAPAAPTLTAQAPASAPTLRGRDPNRTTHAHSGAGA
jgi:hypothetical protein